MFLTFQITAIEPKDNLLPSFSDKFSFRVGAGSGGVVALFLLGRSENKEWGGLVGMAVWSDE